MLARVWATVEAFNRQIHCLDQIDCIGLHRSPDYIEGIRRALSSIKARVYACRKVGAWDKLEQPAKF